MNVHVDHDDSICINGIPDKWVSGLKGSFLYFLKEI